MKHRSATTALLSCLVLVACPGDDEGDTGADSTPTPTSTGSGGTDTMTPPGTTGPDPSTGDPSTGAPAPSTGVADSGSTTDTATDTATDTEDCLTCSQVQNEMGDPALLCEGEALDAFNAVAMCICGNCAQECAATACAMPPMVPDMACLDCFVPQCMEEIGACNAA